MQASSFNPRAPGLSIHVTDPTVDQNALPIPTQPAADTPRTETPRAEIPPEIAEGMPPAAIAILVILAAALGGVVAGGVGGFYLGLKPGIGIGICTAAVIGGVGGFVATFPSSTPGTTPHRVNALVNPMRSAAGGPGPGNGAAESVITITVDPAAAPIAKAAPILPMGVHENDHDMHKDLAAAREKVTAAQKALSLTQEALSAANASVEKLRQQIGLLSKSKFDAQGKQKFLEKYEASITDFKAKIASLETQRQIDMAALTTATVGLMLTRKKWAPVKPIPAPAPAPLAVQVQTVPAQIAV